MATAGTSLPSRDRQRQISEPIAKDYAFDDATAHRPSRARYPTDDSGQLSVEAVENAAVFASESDLSSAASLRGSPKRADGGLDPADDDDDDDSFSASSASTEPEIPSWATLRTTHLFVLLPLTVVIAPLFSLLPVFAWPPSETPTQPGGTPSDLEGVYPRPPSWIAIGLGAFTFLAVRSSRDALVHALQTALSSLKPPSRQRDVWDVPPSQMETRVNAVYSAVAVVVPSIGGTAWTELVRLFSLYVLLRVALPLESPSSPPLSTAATYRISVIDVVFFNSIWSALGYSFSESVVTGCFEWTRQVLLYQDVLDPPQTDPESTREGGLGVVEAANEGEAGNGLMERLQAALESGSTVRPPGIGEEESEGLLNRLEMGRGDGSEAGSSEADQIDELVYAAAGRSSDRQALEAALGAPLWAVPWFVVLVWRVDSTLLTLGTTLFLALPLLPDSAWLPSSPATPSVPLPATAINLSLFPTFVIVLVVRTLITLVWTLGLRRWGIVVVSYGTLLLGLAAFLAGLAVWGGLE